MNHQPKISRTQHQGVRALLRWFHRNPIPTRFLITILQFLLMGLGLIIGHNLYALGYSMPFGVYWLFAVLIVFAFTVVPLFHRTGRFILPAQLRKRRWMYTLLGGGLIGIMIFSGNTLEQQHREMWLTEAVLTIDQAMFPTLDSETPAHVSETMDNLARAIPVASFSAPNTDPFMEEGDNREGNKEKRRKRRKKLRRALILVALGTGAGLIVLLTLATCMGVCIMGAGIALFFTGEVFGILGGLGALALGFLLARFSVRRIRMTGPPPPQKSKNDE